MIDAADNKDSTVELGNGDAGEQFMSLSMAARLLPTIDGRKVAASTIWRWCYMGLRGVLLDHKRVGVKITVSRAGLERFFAAVAEQEPRPRPPVGGSQLFYRRRSISPRRRQRQLAMADEILRRIGISKPASCTSGSKQK